MRDNNFPGRHINSDNEKRTQGRCVLKDFKKKSGAFNILRFE
jgi:hypothetical protein